MGRIKEFVNNKKIHKELMIYLLILFISMINKDNIPIGAIALFMYAYSNCIPVAKTVIISTFGLLMINQIAIIPYLVFLIYFLLSVVIVKPLQAVDNRSEKRKIQNYLLIITSLILIPFFGIVEGIFYVLLELVVYKFLVNGFPVIANYEEKLVFSKEEILAGITVLNTGIIIISTIFGFKYIPIFVISMSIGYIALRYGALLSTISAIILYNLAILLGVKYMLQISYVYPAIYILVFTILGKLKKEVGMIYIMITNLIILSIFNLNLFFIYSLVSIILAIKMKDYEQKTTLINMQNILTADGERRIEGLITKEEEQKIDEENKAETKKENILDENKIKIAQKYIMDFAKSAKTEIVKIYKNESKIVIEPFKLEELLKEVEKIVPEELNKLAFTDEDEEIKEKTQEQKEININKTEKETEKTESKLTLEYINKLIENSDLEIEKISENQVETILNEELILESNFTKFKEKLMNDKKRLENLSIYNEMLYYDNVIKDLYKKIVKNTKTEITKSEFVEILLDNNIIVEAENKNLEMDLKLVNEVFVEKITEIKKEFESKIIQKILKHKIIEFKEAKLKEKLQQTKENQKVENLNRIKEKIKSKSISVKKLAKDLNSKNLKE